MARFLLCIVFHNDSTCVLDPVMFLVMKDPVRLPLSGVIIDRATIKSYLLSDATDPFNRMPLTIEDLIPGEQHLSCYLSLTFLAFNRA